MIYNAPRKKNTVQRSRGVGSVKRKLAAGLIYPEEENACLNVPGVFFA
jgi:hypothetical protein